MLCKGSTVGEMKRAPSINWVVKNDLCLGCGVCQDACAPQAIKFVEKHGLNVPEVDPNSCINEKGCDRCFKVCPGHGIDLQAKSRQYFGAAPQLDPYIGPYVQCYAGWSNEHEIRYHAASGGLLSGFLIYLLDKKIIDGAVVTKFSDLNPLRTQSFIATTRDEILTAKSSKYCPVSLNGVVRKVMSFEGKVIIVGLPCHIEGMRKTEIRNKKFRDNVAGYFSIFCSSNRNFKGINYLLKRHKVDQKDVIKFAFRDEGCLGSMKIMTKDRTVTEPFLQYYGKLRSYFKPRRCSFCIDHYGMLADVSFGDIHIAPYFNNIGVNSLIIRNPVFNKYLRQAHADKYIQIDTVPSTDVNRSQKMMLKNRNVTAPFYLKFERMIGRKVPQYDLPMARVQWLKGARYWFSYTLQRFIGKWLH